jgi:hypothetical protein
MKLARLATWCTIAVLSTAGDLLADPPTFSKQIRPFFARYCLECHAGDKPKGDLSLETYKALQEGGKSGPVVTPGKPDESRLVLLAEGKDKPPMPPKTAKQPKPEEMAVLRAWVAAGAKDDGGAVIVAIPDIKPRVPATAAVTALAYHPGGKQLALGGHREVILLDLTTGDVIGKLPGQVGPVTAVAYSRDGHYLAVASSAPAASGEVRLYFIPSSGIASGKPEFTVAAHKDTILDLAWSPDGKILATGGYDRLIKLLDAKTGQELRTLRDHSDAVYGLAFNPDGRLLASAAADRAVKVWEVTTGKRLYTLGEATDWVYGVAWSPDGRQLAAAGVDKSIRVWEVSPTDGKIVHSVFAHEGPITRLLYASDGKTLYSLSEDRTLKAWDTTRMTEIRVYPRQLDTVLSLALRPDGKQLALGRYDGALLLLNETTGKVQSEPLPIKPKPPVVTKVTPNAAPRGQTVHVAFEGKHLDSINEMTSGQPGIVGKVLTEGKAGVHVDVDLTIASSVPAGVYQLRLKDSSGQTDSIPFTVDLFHEVAEKEPNDSPATGQPVLLPATIVGAMGRAGDVDFFRFETQAGAEIGVQVTAAAIGSKLDPVLQLYDAAGQAVAEGKDSLLGYRCPTAGIYSLGIHDRDYRGGSDMRYRLHVGNVPIVTSLFPLGLQRGTEADIRVEGVNLGALQSVRVKGPADAAIDSRLPVQVATSLGSALGNPQVVVGEFPEVARVGSPLGPGAAMTMPVPGTANGRIERPEGTDTWRFTAKKGQRLVLEINARRIGSPLDSTIEVLDLNEQPIPRAVLRCLAKTFTTFRDHDSAGSGIRIEAWNELAINDYVLIGDELARIRELPKNPDDDCQFVSAGGKRLGFLATTPKHHSLGTPMFKVAIHPPGTTFAPNGLPVVVLSYRNDDGGPRYGKDSRVVFEPPADGDYLVRVGDARNLGGSNYAYRLTIRPPRPSYAVSFDPTAPAVWKGGAIPITVSAERIDDFDGPIDVRLENMPPGFSAPATTIPAGENSTTFAFYAEPTAAAPTKAPPLKLAARAMIEGKQVVREVTGGLPKVMEPGDIVTTTAQQEVTLKPGGHVTLTAAIERRNRFAGRVPLDVKGLPHGVRVLDIGLNGILITEKESNRTFVIYAEPWVEPMEHPFVVLARREGKNTEHAARSVVLKVVPK